MKKITKIETTTYFKKMLSTSTKWAVAGMVKIYEYQTADEQNTEETHESNGVGFSHCDANILTSFSKQVGRGWNLSPKQMALVFKKMPKYARQLIEHADTEKVNKAILARRAA